MILKGLLRLVLVLVLVLVVFLVHICCLSTAVVVPSFRVVALTWEGIKPQVNQFLRPVDCPRCSLKLNVTPLLPKLSRRGVRDRDRAARLGFEALDAEALLSYDPAHTPFGNGQTLKDLRQPLLRRSRTLVCCPIPLLLLFKRSCDGLTCFCFCFLGRLLWGEF